jgi:pimeloyl-ACP methyl ester carboxylesterase
MLAAGYATLNFDPLGFGQSSHPLSALVTIESDAFVTHQVIQAARKGTFGIKFPRVILVGHSMGTAVAWREAAAYHDINGMIASGNSHHQSLITTLKTPLITYPAFLDPKFSGQHLDPGYFTTRPGTRIDVFYNRADASPAVVAEDEKTKDTVTLTFLATYFAEDVDLDTSRIHVPVLIANGQDDALMCKGLGADDCSSSSALLRSEAPFYSPSACLQAYVLPKAGHDLNLSLNAQSFFQVAKRWANTWVGASGSVRAHHCDGPVGPAS